MFTVITPTHNRADYLGRVYESLKAQTYRNFEWIIADDGSTDNTEDIAHRFINDCLISVTYVKFSLHVGKPVVDNKAVEYARNELTLWCDSDDELLPNTLEKLSLAWNSIPNNQKEYYCGITGLAVVNSHPIVNPFAKLGSKDTSWNDLAVVHNVSRDMSWCIKTSLLKRNKFPEVDLVVPESSVWRVLGHMKTRFINTPLIQKHYGSKGAISFSKKMSYNRGRAYSLAISCRELRNYKRPLAIQMVEMFNFIRYSIHGEMSAIEILKLWPYFTLWPLFMVIIPLSCLACMKDCFQQKVIYSHRIFKANYSKATYVVRSNLPHTNLC